MIEKHINQYASEINGDKEHDEYVLFQLMKIFNIDTTESGAFEFLNKRLCEELDVLIDTLHKDEEYFTSESSEVVNSIGILLGCIFNISNIDVEPDEEVRRKFYISI